MSETPSLKRDSTMAVTAQEGEAFLEAQGMAVTDDDVKTRNQKEKLEEIESEGGPPKVARAGTMVVTAEEGTRLLDGCGDLERTRAQTAVVKETVEESKAEESKTTSPLKPSVVRDNTMTTTAQEGEALLEGQKLAKTRGQTKEAAAAASPTTPTKVKRSTTIAKTAEASSHILGSEERGRTRSQTRRMSEKEDETTPTKPSVKRASTTTQTAKEGEEFLERQAKQAKLDENGDKAGTAEATEAEA